MTSAAFELQKAIVEALRADTSLTAIMGEPRIYDAAPADVAFPYVVIGRTSIYDWSTATENGSEHLLTLHFWSRARGKREAFAMIDAAAESLGGVLSIEGHHLVTLTREGAEVRFEENLGLHHGQLRLRALVDAAG